MGLGVYKLCCNPFCLDRYDSQQATKCALYQKKINLKKLSLSHKHVMLPFPLTVFFPGCFAVSNIFTAIPVKFEFIINYCKKVFSLPQCFAVNSTFTAVDVNNYILLNYCKSEIYLPECIAIYSIILSYTITV